MKQIVFHRWARKELSSFYGGEFNFTRLSTLCQSRDDLRLRALLVLYAIDARRTNKLVQYLWDGEIVREYKHVIEVIGSRDIGKLALRGTPMRALPKHYVDVMEEFSHAFNAFESKANSKRALWEETRKLQLRLGATNADIYHALQLNPGNVNAYLKHGAVEKVSLKNAERIYNYLLALPQS